MRKRLQSNPANRHPVNRKISVSLESFPLPRFSLVKPDLRNSAIYLPPTHPQFRDRVPDFPSLTVQYSTSRYCWEKLASNPIDLCSSFSAFVCVLCRTLLFLTCTPQSLLSLFLLLLGIEKKKQLFSPPLLPPLPLLPSPLTNWWLLLPPIPVTVHGSTSTADSA